MRPGTLGSSGTALRCLSRARLKEPTEQPDVFLKINGRLLNTLGPFTPMLLYLIVRIRHGAANWGRSPREFSTCIYKYIVLFFAEESIN